MYIKNGTRDGYNSSNRLLLLWLDEKHKDCVSEQAKTALEHTFQIQIAASDKYKNKAVERKALELVANANSIETSPIIFSNVTARHFVDFVHYRARIRGNTFLSKSGCGSFRSTFRERHRQCGTKISSALKMQRRTMIMRMSILMDQMWMLRKRTRVILNSYPTSQHYYYTSVQLLVPNILIKSYYIYTTRVDLPRMSSHTT